MGAGVTTGPVSGPGAGRAAGSGDAGAVVTASAHSASSADSAYPVTGSSPLGIGIGWRPEIAAAVEAMPGVEWVEAVAENLCPGQLPESLLRLRARGVTVVPHGVSLGLGGADRPDEGRLAALAERARALGAPLVTEHIAFVRAGGSLTATAALEAGHLLPVPRTRDALDVLCENVRIAQSALPVPLAVENIAALFSWPGEELTEGQFLYDLADRTGVRLLIDVANLHTNHVNCGEDPAKALSELPLEAIAYVHVAGGYEQNGIWHDSHAHPVPPAVLNILTDLTSRVTPPGILLERDENFPEPGVLEEELAAIRGAVREGVSGRSGAVGVAVGARGDGGGAGRAALVLRGDWAETGQTAGASVPAIGAGFAAPAGRAAAPASRGEGGATAPAASDGQPAQALSAARADGASQPNPVGITGARLAGASPSAPAGRGTQRSATLLPDSAEDSGDRAGETLPSAPTGTATRNSATSRSGPAQTSGGQPGETPSSAPTGTATRTSTTSEPSPAETSGGRPGEAPSENPFQPRAAELALSGLSEVSVQVRTGGYAEPGAAATPAPGTALRGIAALHTGGSGATPSSGTGVDGGALSRPGGSSGLPGPTPPSPARQRLALAQTALLSALVAGTPAPEGFDRERIGVQARALAVKRAGVVGKVAPELPEILGGRFRSAFLSYARRRPMRGGYRQDALDFAEHLLEDGELTGRAQVALRDWWLDRSGPAPRKRPSPLDRVRRSLIRR